MSKAILNPKHNQPSANDAAKIHEMHFSVAEYGKVMALQHKHDDALRHYREAIRLAVSCKAPEVFFRHYTQCVLESLELTGSYKDVIDFCSNACRHYESLQTSLPLHKKDYGSVLERGAVNLLKSGEVELAKAWLKQAMDVAGSGVLPFSEELAQWLGRGLSVNQSRLLTLQKKHKYFVVRADQVDKSKARPVEAIKAPMAGSAPAFGI